MKIFSLISILFNMTVWFSTCDSSRMSMRMARPEIKAELQRVAEETLKKQESEKAAASAKSEAEEREKRSKSEKAAGVVLLNSGFLAGSVAFRDNYGVEFKGNIVFAIWRTRADDIEPNQWRARVSMINDPGIVNMSTWRATPVPAGDGSVGLAFEPTEKNKYYYASFTSADRETRHAQLSLGADGQMVAVLGGDAEERSFWKSKMQIIPLENVKQFEGTWSGDLKGRKNSKLTLAIDAEKSLSGTLTQPDPDRPSTSCIHQLRAHPIEKDLIYVYVGMRDTTHSTSYSCDGGYAMKLRIRDLKQLIGALSEDGRLESDPVQFTK